MPEEERPDEEVEEVEDQEVDDLEDTDDEDTDDWKPPTKEEWTKLTNAAKARKRERDQVKRELATLKNGKQEEEDGDKEAKKWRTTAARNSAATALAAAGFAGTARQARRLTRLLDLDNIEPDDTGDFDLDDEIDELKEEFPQLFAQQEEKRRAPRVTTSDRGRGQQGTRDRTTDRLLKQAGYR